MTEAARGATLLSGAGFGFDRLEKTQARGAEQVGIQRGNSKHPVPGSFKGMGGIGKPLGDFPGLFVKVAGAAMGGHTR